MFPRVLTLALAFCLFFVATSFADTFAWSYTGDGVNASGTFTTDPISGGTYLITGITGQRNGEIITGLSTFGGANNLLYTVFAYFDIFGLSYVAGGTAYNVYGTGQVPGPGVGEVPIEGYFSLDPVPHTVNTELTNLSITRLGEVPEPSSFFLVSSGVAAALLRRRRKVA